jgi:hypothetical protein
MHREVLMCEASSRPPSVGKSNQAIPRPHIQLKHHSSGKHNGDGGCDQPGPESESALKTYERWSSVLFKHPPMSQQVFWDDIINDIHIEYHWIPMNINQWASYECFEWILNIIEYISWRRSLASISQETTPPTTGASNNLASGRSLFRPEKHHLFSRRVSQPSNT